MARYDSCLGCQLVYHRGPASRPVLRPADHPIYRKDTVRKGRDSSEMGREGDLHLATQLQHLTSSYVVKFRLIYMLVMSRVIKSVILFSSKEK